MVPFNLAKRSHLPEDGKKEKNLEGCIGFALFHLNQVEILATIAASIAQTP